ncbi:Uncharacterised protein [Shigella sonnei]|nr:Uncharacterised protein [Shigella sonnei]
MLAIFRLIRRALFSELMELIQAIDNRSQFSKFVIFINKPA